MKQQMKIVAPVILHNQRLAAGPDVFEGVVGGSNFYWGSKTRSRPRKSSTTRFVNAVMAGVDVLELVRRLGGVIDGQPALVGVVAFRA